MKIMLINALYYPYSKGGAGRSVQIIAETLKENGHDVVVLTTHGKKYDLINYINGVKVYYLKVKNIYWPYQNKSKNFILKIIWHLIDSMNFLMARRVKKIVDYEMPNVVHTNTLECFSTLIWRCLHKYNVPIVHTLRDYRVMCPLNMFKNNESCSVQCCKCKLYSLPNKMRAKYISRLVGISEFIVKKHKNNGFFCNKLSSIVFNPYLNYEIPIHKNHETKKGLVFGFIGKIGDYKGFDILLRCLNRIEDYNFKLLVAGSLTCEYKRYLERMYDLSKVDFLGFVKPEEFYSKIDVLIVPSKWDEPLSRVTLEAYLFGIPVIGANRGGIPEIINERFTGYLFDPEKCNELCKIMIYFIENQQIIKEMSEYCLKKAEEFEPENIARQYIQIYNHTYNLNLQETQKKDNIKYMFILL